jgi:hypothetical protein
VGWTLTSADVDADIGDPGIQGVGGRGNVNGGGTQQGRHIGGLSINSIGRVCVPERWC